MELWRAELYHHGIKGQKWGVRRYQNSDGSLTDAGRKRYGYGERGRQTSASTRNGSGKSALKSRAGSARFLDEYRDAEGNLNERGQALRKQYNDINSFNEARNRYLQGEEAAIKDRYSRVSNTIGIASESLKGARSALETYEKVASRRSKKGDTIDLSAMSDKELQQRINRLNMEQQYARLTAAPETHRGRDAVKNTLDVAGGVLAVASSAVTIAVAINQLKKG